MCIERMHNNSAMERLIGKMDRLLSESIIMSSCLLDLADEHTLKHHAEDMIGAGKKILSNLAATKKAINKAKVAKTPVKATRPRKA